MFVVNRIHQIKKNTRVDQWNYVSSKENPADDASRGHDHRKETSNSRWFHGPSFLWQVESLWQSKDGSIGPLNDDVKLKRETKSNAIQIVDDVLANTERQVSGWAKLKPIVGYVLLYRRTLLQSCNKGNPTQKEEPNRKVVTRINWLCFRLKAQNIRSLELVKEDISVIRSS